MTNLTLRNIAVGVDFGPASGRAVELAGAIAETLGGTLTLVHAQTLDVPPYFTREQLDGIERELRAARRHARDQLTAFASKYTRATVKPLLTDEPPAESLLDAAQHADMLAVGTHGWRGPRRWWLGSVAERVVRGSTVPVLVAHDQPGPAWASSPSRAILLLGGSAAPQAAVRWANELARALGAPVDPGHSVETCQASAVKPSHLVVVPLPGVTGERAIHEATVTLTRSCRAPLLFVPV